MHYLNKHNKCREEIFDALNDNKMYCLPGESWLVNKLVIGSLNNEGIIKFLQEYKILVRNEPLTLELYKKYFCKVILSLSLPEMRPVLYLRLRARPMFMKYGPLTLSEFTFERNIMPARTAFFDWLESTNLEVQITALSKFLHRFMNQNVVGSKRKFGETENLEQLKKSLIEHWR